MSEIVHQFHITATPERLYQMIVEREGLIQWWTKDVVAEPIVGSIAQFGFNHRQHVFKMKIVELEPYKKVKWVCLGENPEWVDTEIVFELIPAAEGTTLNFSHTNWKSDNGIFSQCKDDWARYLGSLSSFLEIGKGSPHRDSP